MFSWSNFDYRDAVVKINDSIVDSIQYTEYYEDGGHYDWHMDVGNFPENHRKISITIQLSNPDDYDGGDLEFWLGKVPTKPRACLLALRSMAVPEE